MKSLFASLILFAFCASILALQNETFTIEPEFQEPNSTTTTTTAESIYIPESNSGKLEIQLISLTIHVAAKFFVKVTIYNNSYPIVLPTETCTYCFTISTHPVPTKTTHHKWDYWTSGWTLNNISEKARIAFEVFDNKTRLFVDEAANDVFIGAATVTLPELTEYGDIGQKIPLALAQTGGYKAAGQLDVKIRFNKRI